MSKAPSLQFYPGDWQRDTALKMCSLAARGLWVEMMWLMFDGDPYGHLSVKGSVIPTDKLPVILGVDAMECQTLVNELEHYGVFSRTPEGCIYSRRMVSDRQRRDTNTLNGSKGGNPRLSKSVKSKVNPLRADAVADTSTTSLKERASELVIPEPFAEIFADFKAHRKEIRKPMTPRAEGLTLEKLVAMGILRAKAAVKHTITNGWQGIVEPRINGVQPSDPTEPWNPRA